MGNVVNDSIAILDSQCLVACFNKAHGWYPSAAILAQVGGFWEIAKVAGYPLFKLMFTRV